MQEQPSQEQPLTPLSHEERLERMARIVSTKTLEGWNVVDKNERDVWAVLLLPAKPVNHTVHAIITIFTCALWAPVWLIIYLTHQKEQRVRVSIDNYGNLLEEKITLA